MDKNVMEKPDAAYLTFHTLTEGRFFSLTFHTLTEGRFSA